MANIAKILDDCVENITQGEINNACLENHPSRLDELAPLLGIAKTLAAAREEKMPFPARERIRVRVFSQIAYDDRSTAYRPGKNRSFRLAFTALIIVLIFLTTGTALAQTALPGGVLYPWKRTSEQMYRLLSPDTLKVDLFLANRRSVEFLIVHADSDQKELAFADYLEALSRLETYDDQDQESRALIQQNLEEQREALERAGIVVPEVIYLLRENPESATPLPEKELTPDCLSTRSDPSSRFRVELSNSSCLLND